VSITVQLDLSAELAEKARAAGLLDPKRVASLIARELNLENDQRSFFELAREIRAQPGEPMSSEEIQAEVDAVRSAKRSRETGH
jgi:hypothetical protein